MSVRMLNSKAELVGKNAALTMNVQAAGGLQQTLASNLGPTGTIKMYVDEKDIMSIDRVMINDNNVR